MARLAGRRLGIGRRELTSFYVTAVVLLLVLLLQATLLSRLRLVGASPNLLLVAVVCWSLIRGVADGLVWAFAGGLGIDLVSGLPLGTSSLALMVTCPLTELGRNSVFPGSLTLPSLLVALATPVYGWTVLFIQQLQGVPVDWLTCTVRIIAPELALNVALVVLVYPMLRWLAAQTRPDTAKW